MERANYADAIKLFTELIDTNPKNTKKETLGFVIGQRGYARMLSGDLKGGIVDANKSLELGPNNLWMRKNRAIAYHKLGQHDLARIIGAFKALARERVPDGLVVETGRILRRDHSVAQMEVIAMRARELGEEHIICGMRWWFPKSRFRWFS